MSTYQEKLKNPKWQKKRLEILQRDDFKCQLCKDDRTELHVHHLKYTKEPWNAPNEDLQTLCKHCHSFIEFFKKSNRWEFEFITDIIYKYQAFESYFIVILTEGQTFLFFYVNKEGTFFEDCSIGIDEITAINKYLHGKGTPLF